IRGVGDTVGPRSRREGWSGAFADHARHGDLASRIDRDGLRDAPSRSTKEIGEHDRAAGIELDDKGSLAGEPGGRYPKVTVARDGKIRRCGRAGDIHIPRDIYRNGVGRVLNRSAEVAHIQILAALRVQLDD